MAMLLEEDSETTWNDSYTYYVHVSWGGQRNYLKSPLYLFRPYFLRRTAKLPEIIAIPIMAIFLEEDSETTWNNSYTCYGHISRGGQRNRLKWQLLLFSPCFLWRTVKLPEMTAIPIMAMFLQENSETTWNDSYTYFGHISWGASNSSYTYCGHIPWGGQRIYLKLQQNILCHFSSEW